MRRHNHRFGRFLGRPPAQPAAGYRAAKQTRCCKLMPQKESAPNSPWKGELHSKQARLSCVATTIVLDAGGIFFSCGMQFGQNFRRRTDVHRRYISGCGMCGLGKIFGGALTCAGQYNYLIKVATPLHRLIYTLISDTCSANPRYLLTSHRETIRHFSIN